VERGPLHIRACGAAITAANKRCKGPPLLFVYAYTYVDSQAQGFIANLLRAISVHYRFRATNTVGRRTVAAVGRVHVHACVAAE
jgi:hypothetical protein